MRILGWVQKMVGLFFLLGVVGCSTPSDRPQVMADPSSNAAGVIDGSDPTMGILAVTAEFASPLEAEDAATLMVQLMAEMGFTGQKLLIARQSMELYGQGPFFFYLEYPLEQIQPNRRYHIEGEVLLNGEVVRSTLNWPWVLTHGHGDEVTLVLGP